LRAGREALVHRFLDLADVAFFDQVRDIARVDHDFDGGLARAACGRFDQALRDDGFHGGRQVLQQRRAVFDRIETDDAVQRVVAVIRVQRGQDQVARLGVGQRRRHGFLVADFADQDAVRRLAHGVAQGDRKTGGVAADFALVDDRFLVLEQILDRIFQRQDVAGAQFVAVVQHRRDRGRFAGAGSAHDEHQAAFFHDQVGQDRRQAEVCQRRDHGRDKTEHCRDAAALAERRQAEAPQVVHRDAHVELVILLELGHLFRRGDFRQQRDDVVLLQLVLVNRDQVAVDLDVDRRIHREEHVRSVLLFHQLE